MKFELKDVFYERKKGSREVTATVYVQHPDGRLDERSAVGNGPVSAVFKAIGFSVGRVYTVEKFNIRAEGAGEDAAGQCSLDLVNGSIAAGGQGQDDDIVIASAQAYIDSLNRINGFVEGFRSVSVGMRGI